MRPVRWICFSVGLQDAFILYLPEPEGFFIYTGLPAQALVSQQKSFRPRGGTH
jgi:hypothetical protein